MKLSFLSRPLLAAALLLPAVATLADDYPSGYSLVPSAAIGGVEGGSSPATDGHNITLPAKGAEAIHMACLKQGSLWIYGEPKPRTCYKVVVEAGVLLLWLAPAVKPPMDGVMSPPVLLSATAFPNQSYKERVVSAGEMTALRKALEEPGSAGSSVQPAARMSAIDIAGSGTVYYLIAGRQVLDSNEEESCATTATLLYVKNGNGLNYGGELEAHPAAFVQRTAGSLPDAIVTKDCGKKMSLWQVAPKTRQLINYSNGYEYGG
ncbi:hypothetical protein [Dyella sp.]|uniref:hypothetical protein n=1 Tax=Dyella sp. TaxID=1869338 RepID=UPI002ED4BC5F